MTDPKRQALENLAVAVLSNFKQLDESEVVGRVMLLTGRNFKRCSEGFRILMEGGFIKTEFISPETRGKFRAWVEENPNLAEMFDRLDLVPGKMTIRANQTISVKIIAPKPVSLAYVRKRLNLNKLDF